MALSKVTYKWDLGDLLEDVPESKRKAAIKEAAQYLLEQVLADVGEGKSPVTGHAFKKLSEDYAAFKRGESSNPIANLELSGDLLDALDFKVTGTGFEFGVWGEEAPKADGHNNHSGDSELPRRPFIPKKSEEFRPGIRSEVEDIILSYAEEKVKR